MKRQIQDVSGRWTHNFRPRSVAETLGGITRSAWALLEGLLMITGVHAIVYSTAAEADRAFLRELLGTHHVDAGDGWLILSLPPAEIAVHPTDGAPKHELHLLCDDIEQTVSDLAARGVTFDGGVTDRSWGLWTSIRLPSGGTLGLYQPRHPVAAGKTAANPR